MPALATAGFVEQFIVYVQRWIHRQQSQSERALAEPAGPGRPCALPAEVLWSTLLLSVLQRVRGVREAWRALVCQGYDICDQAVYARLERDGIEPVQALFAQMSRMLAAWIQPLVEAQPWEGLDPFARAVLALDETTLDPLARKLPQLRLWWNSKLTGILQQLWACLIIAQLVQALRMESAVRAHVDPFEVSMPLVVRALPSLLEREQDPIALCVQRGRQLGFIRPSRRLHLQVPVIVATDIVPRPADLLLERPACYPAETASERRSQRTEAR